MIPRYILPILLALLAVLLVTFAVLMGGYGIATAVGDTTGAKVLGWVAIFCAVFLVSDCLLLLAALAITQIDQSRARKPCASDKAAPTTPDSRSR